MKGLVILHIDGLSFEAFQEGLRKNKMPYAAKLMQEEGYELLQYRTGLPSTTPSAQAGILFGDNREIPSFRWFDKESGVEVRFGPRSTFKKVAHKYFKNSKPLTQNGACIATCYPAGAKETFALAYRMREDVTSRPVERKLLFKWVKNPFYVLDWLYYSSLILIKTVFEYIRLKMSDNEAVLQYVIGNLIDELFLHHLARLATGIAMEEKISPVYTAVYAYDETAHAFGPQDPLSVGILSQIDKTIEYIAKKRKPHKNQEMEYELLMLSDHGQIPTIPFKDRNGKGIRERVGELLPTYEIKDVVGKTHEKGQSIDGHVRITYSGGMAHVYFINISYRMTYGEIEKKFPNFIKNIVKMDEIAFVMVKETKNDLLITKKGKIKLGNKLDKKAIALLKKFDESDIVARQLKRLNTFKKAGDLILIGEYKNGKQINFEAQAGGHGSIGGNQMLPFVLAKKEWKLNLSKVENATQLYPILRKLQERD